MFANFFGILADFAGKFSFDAVVWFTWGTFAAVFAAALTLTLACPWLRKAGKKPFLCLVNCYAVITAELFLTQTSLSRAVFVSGVFWLAGYLCYGILCALSRIKTRRPPAQIAATATVCPPAQAFYKTPSQTPPDGRDLSAAKNNVKLEHAAAVTERLLEKNLGKSDRQQLEKLKTTLEVLRVKGELTPAEGEMLNENFNALLKLMAKYNV